MNQLTPQKRVVFRHKIRSRSSFTNRICCPKVNEPHHISFDACLVCDDAEEIVPLGVYCSGVESQSRRKPLDRLIFHLARSYPPYTPIQPYLHNAYTLYEQIKLGKKTSEWREAKNYWWHRFFDCPRMNREISFPAVDAEKIPVDLTRFGKIKQVWFVEYYPKNNLPRLEADVVALLYHPEVLEFPASNKMIEISFVNVREVKTEK
jgi:hypothetical protein